MRASPPAPSLGHRPAKDPLAWSGPLVGGLDEPGDARGSRQTVPADPDPRGRHDRRRRPHRLGGLHRRSRHPSRIPPGRPSAPVPRSSSAARPTGLGSGSSSPRSGSRRAAPARFRSRARRWWPRSRTSSRPPTSPGRRPSGSSPSAGFPVSSSPRLPAPASRPVSDRALGAQPSSPATSISGASGTATGRSTSPRCAARTSAYPSGPGPRWTSTRSAPRSAIQYSSTPIWA